MILITGASGFIGKALCRHLLEQNLPVRGLVRSDRGALMLPFGVETVRVDDIAAHEAWDEILTGVSAVVHLAARVPGSRASRSDFLRTNVDGTSRLAYEAARAGVRRFVYVSSAKVHGEGRSEPYREEDLVAPHGPYAESKCHAEQAVLGIAAETQLETVVLRPPVVYGPGVKESFLRLIQFVSWGVPLPSGLMAAPRSMLFLGNLVTAIEACLFHPRAAGKIFLARDGEDLALMDVVCRIAAAMKRAPRFFRLPGEANLGKILGLKQSSAPLRVDDTLIRRTLGWHPSFSCDDGLEQTVLWYLQGRR